MHRGTYVGTGIAVLGDQAQGLMLPEQTSVTELHPQSTHCFIRVGKAADVGIHGDSWNRFLAAWSCYAINPVEFCIQPGLGH